MNKFESVIIVKPEVEKEKILEITEEVEKIVGNLTSYENLGIKKLAYEIKKYAEGCYLIFYFETELETTKELEKYYRLEEDILKFIIVRNDD